MQPSQQDPAPAEHANPELIPVLTGLRFVAALAVVVYHFAPFLELSSVLHALCSQGKAGVSFFFVLSGFILTYVYLEKFRHGVTRPQLLRFLRARLARIYPMHLVALLLISPLILAFLLQGSPHLPGIAASNVTLSDTVMSWLSNLLLVQVYIPSQYYQHLWNQPSWSLGAELFFYACFPFVAAYTLQHLSHMRQLLTAAVSMIVIESGLFLLSIFLILKSDPSSMNVWIDLIPYRLPFFRIWEFIIGCLCGAMYLNVRLGKPGSIWVNWLQFKKNRDFTIFILSIMIIGLSFIPWGTSIVGRALDLMRWYPLYTPLFAALVFILAIGNTFLHPLLCRSSIVSLGEASYSLYVLHWIPAIALYFARASGIQFDGTAVIVVISFTVCAAVVAHRQVEVPMRQLVLKAAWPKRRGGASPATPTIGLERSSPPRQPAGQPPLGS